MGIRKQYVYQKIFGNDLKGGLFSFLDTKTCANEILVIRKLGLSPRIVTSDGKQRRYDGSAQIFIANTPLFVGPDLRPRGVSNHAIPDDGKQLLRLFNVIVPPGTGAEIKFQAETKFAQSDRIYASVAYELYEGSDAVLADELTRMDIMVSFDNIDWLKHKLSDDDPIVSGVKA